MTSVVQPQRGRSPTRSRGQLATWWLVVTGTAFLGMLGAYWSLAWAFLLGSLPLAALAGLRCRQWAPVFGPVFVYDLVRTARRGQLTGHRCLYAGLLLAMLLVVFWSWFPYSSLEGMLKPTRLRPPELSRFAESIFTWFMTVQLLVIALVTPAYTAGAIAEEKERRTLDFLLATDLSSREIVVGLLASRLANLLLLVLVGLPVLSLVQLLGGVDPNLVLAGFLTTFTLTLSLGGLSILVSVHCRTALSAVVSTYLWMPVHFLMCGTLLLFVFPLFLLLGSDDWFVGGLLGVSLIFTILGVLCCRGAVTMLRPLALGMAAHDRIPLWETYPTPPTFDIPEVAPAHWPRRPSQGWGPYPDPVALRVVSEAASPPRYRRRLPPVGPDALLWKELHAQPPFFTPDKMLLLLAFGGWLLIPLAAAVTSPLLDGTSTKGLGETTNPLVRKAGVAISGVLFLVVALSAAGRVSRERERQTLDSLLTLPGEWGAILFAKWLGSLLSVRGLAVALGVVWILGVVTGGVCPFALPLLVGAVAVHAAFLAALGLWLSTVCRTTLRANLLAVLAALALMVGPSLWQSNVGSEVLRAPAEGSWFAPPQGSWLYLLDFGVSWASLLLAFGLSPPATIWLFSYHVDELSKGPEELALARVMAALAGLHIYLAATVVLGLAARARLRAEKGPRPRQPPGEGRPG